MITNIDAFYIVLFGAGSGLLALQTAENHAYRHSSVPWHRPWFTFEPILLFSFLFHLERHQFTKILNTSAGLRLKTKGIDMGCYFIPMAGGISRRGAFR
jgi:hypothetical protein